MLKIRPEQLAAFSHHKQLRILIDDLTEMVRDLDDPRYAKLPVREIARRVEAGVRRAEGYGLSSGNGIRVYVTLLFRIGPFFDERPAIRTVLELQASSEEKLELLAAMPEREWAIATVTADETRWPELTGADEQ